MIYVSAWFFTFLVVFVAASVLGVLVLGNTESAMAGALIVAFSSAHVAAVITDQE